MSSTLNTSPRRAPFAAYALMLVTGLATAAAIAGTATTIRGEDLAYFGAFAAIVAGPCLSVTWLIFVSGHTVTRDRHGQDNAESRWITEATSSACLDLVAAAGIALLILSVTRTLVSGMSVLAGVIVLAAADIAIRYVVARRRES